MTRDQNQLARREAGAAPVPVYLLAVRAQEETKALARDCPVLLKCGAIEHIYLLFGVKINICMPTP